MRFTRIFKRFIYHLYFVWAVNRNASFRLNNQIIILDPLVVPCKIDKGDLFGRRTATLTTIRRTVVFLSLLPCCCTMLCAPLSAVKEMAGPFFLRTFSHGDTCSLNAGSVVVVAESKLQSPFVFRAP